MTTPTPSQPREILACAEAGVARRREAEVDDLLLLLAWADAHSGDPQAEPGAIPVRYGGPRLVTVGGDGTPRVSDLCFAEIAVARQAGEVATRHAVADALDLRHRLPLLWGHVQRLDCETWVARKIARLSRPLAADRVPLVDAAVAAAIHQSPTRLLALAEAKIIEADQAAHQQRIDANQAKIGVWFPLPRTGERVDDGPDNTAGLRAIVGRLEENDAIELDQTLDELADILALESDHDPEQPSSRGMLRTQALGLLARPADALALLEPAPQGDEPSIPSRRRPATVVVHISEAALAGDAEGIARVEEVGPMLLTQLRNLLGHRDVSLRPVIDLRTTRSVNGYEHPTDVRRRTLLRTLGDVFPHSTGSPGVRVDHDHPTPYDDAGPPGQTGDHNDAPLTRRHHRAKTHHAYRVDQLALSVYRWRTPHGLARLVTPAGTHRIDLLTDSAGDMLGELHPDAPALTLAWGA